MATNSGPSSGWVNDFLNQQCTDVEWLIRPLLPKGGVVFLHGPTSAGKSPFTWALAVSVSEGLPFAGYPVQTPGTVLYIELDTPANLLQPRLRLLRVLPEFMWLEVFARPIDICNLTDDDATAIRLRELYDSVQPVLVIVNTLRKAHAEDDKDSNTPSKVYNAWMDYFPGAAFVFVHHDKKTPVKDGSKTVVDEDQMFSGSQHWQNDSQIAWHLTRMKREKKPAVTAGEAVEYQKTPIMVRVTKSQVSDHERIPPLQMRLEPDGTNWVEMGPAAYRHFFESMSKGVPRARRIEAVIENFGIGKSAAYAACEGME